MTRLTTPTALAREKLWLAFTVNGEGRDLVVEGYRKPAPRRSLWS